MIRISKKNSIITITGHANYADVGKDIVCASVSSIVYTTVNALLKLNNDSINFTDNAKTIQIEIKSDDNITKSLINNMFDLLNDLSNDYPNNIKVESEE